ncbi:MAG: hypothetical protein D3910_05455 [Candidatus Electrothrix sp. ATG2]|nr:hypothetical protein [Candidatus Electrothrix sp. ATG2]
MKEKIMIVILGLAACFIMSGSASAVTPVDTNSIEATVDRLITQMQQETIKQNIASLLLKNEMRPKMMAERVPQNFMLDSVQPIIRPVMVEKVRAEIQAQQLELMTKR